MEKKKRFSFAKLFGYSLLLAVLGVSVWFLLNWEDYSGALQKLDDKIAERPDLKIEEVLPQKAFPVDDSDLGSIPEQYPNLLGEPTAFPFYRSKTDDLWLNYPWDMTDIRQKISVVLCQANGEEAVPIDPSNYYFDDFQQAAALKRSYLETLPDGVYNFYFPFSETGAMFRQVQILEKPEYNPDRYEPLMADQLLLLADFEGYTARIRTTGDNTIAAVRKNMVPDLGYLKEDEFTFTPDRDGFTIPKEFFTGDMEYKFIAVLRDGTEVEFRLVLLKKPLDMVRLTVPEYIPADAQQIEIGYELGEASKLLFGVVYFEGEQFDLRNQNFKHSGGKIILDRSVLDRLPTGKEIGFGAVGWYRGAVGQSTNTTFVIGGPAPS